MDDLSTAYEWAKTHDFDEEQLHYCTILALKILDGQCKMDYDNYNLFMSVYDGILDKSPTPFDKKVDQIIALSRTQDPLIPKPEYKEAIRKLRVAMMENMQKPLMKGFKKFVWDSLP
ncbi:MAG: hypothetical protein U9Q33_05285 [Campylobacterota bacterium]|nr:hypothetical protein [Campylobacterota bacterium]